MRAEAQIKARGLAIISKGSQSLGPAKLSFPNSAAAVIQPSGALESLERTVKKYFKKSWQTLIPEWFSPPQPQLSLLLDTVLNFSI